MPDRRREDAREIEQFRRELRVVAKVPLKRRAPRVRLDREGVEHVLS